MIYLSIRFIKYLYYCSIFFFQESRNYISHWTIETILYYPIAYLQFLELMIGEFKPFIENEEKILNGENNE